LRSPGNALVTLEIAIALTLTLGAGLLLNSFARLMHVNPGFRAEGAMAAIIVLPRTQYPDAKSNINFFRRVVERLEAQPGIEAAGVSNSLPMSGHGNGAYLHIEGLERAKADDPSMLSATHLVSGNYLRALGTTLLSGRLLTAHDTADAPLSAVINDSAAERFWPGQDPIGKRFSFDQRGGRDEWRQVVGIVKATHLKRLDESPVAEVYIPIEQASGRADILIARSAMPQAGLAAALRHAVAEVDKNQPIFLTMSMQDLVADSVARQRFSLLLLGVFSVLALLLAALGVYGVVSFAVAQRTREIGIRIALGAQRPDVLRMIVASGMQPVAIGAVTGLIAAMVFSRVLTSLLYGVTATDPVTFAGVSLLILIVALVACYVPARKAAKVDPMVALRTE
jgi:putative ABC transport system permease protein